jgi:hypothetical protein
MKLEIPTVNVLRQLKVKCYVLKIFIVQCNEIV